MYTYVYIYSICTVRDRFRGQHEVCLLCLYVVLMCAEFWAPGPDVGKGEQKHSEQVGIFHTENEDFWWGCFGKLYGIGIL